MISTVAPRASYMFPRFLRNQMDQTERVGDSDFLLGGSETDPRHASV